MLHLSPTKHGPIIVAVIIAVAILALRLSYDNLGVNERVRFWEQIANTAMQVIVATTIGLSITLLVETIKSKEDERLKREEWRQGELRQWNEYQMDLQRRLRAAYNDVKVVRRHFQRAGFKHEALGIDKAGDS